MATESNLHPLRMTSDELSRISEAVKKPEFRLLLREYIQDVTSEDSRTLRESEVIRLEEEKTGMIPIFLHPKPGYVLKTFDLKSLTKVFINICTEEQVEKPQYHKGSNVWSIPYSLTPQRRDLDKKGNVCFVYDVMFHPNVLKLSHDNKEFKTLVKETSLDAVESSGNSQVCLDRTLIKFPKMTFKGSIHSTMVKKENTAVDVENQSKTPQYSLKYRDNITDKITWSLNNNRNVCCPSEIVIAINLPQLSRASEISLDVTETQLTLQANHPSKYFLDLNLPYSVHEELGNAKFDTVSKELTVVLPIQQPKLRMDRLTSTDSGVESDYFENSQDDAHHEVECKTPENTAPYLKPSYTLQLKHNSLIIILDVKNVNLSTIFQNTISSQTFSGFQVRFSSIGPSLFKLDYSFALAFPVEDFQCQYNIKCEESNVIVQVEICEEFKDIFIGTSQLDLVIDPIFRTLRSEGKKESEEINKNKDFTNSSSRIFLSPDNQFDETSLTDAFSSISKNFDACNSNGLRSILKHRHRCFSESQAEQIKRWEEAAAALTNPLDVAQDSSLKDENRCRDGLNESYDLSRKSVRFNEVVQRQIFRQNSSILGQKHKNFKKNEQRKRKNMRQRRLSEGDAENGRDDSNCISSGFEPICEPVVSLTTVSNNTCKNKKRKKKKSKGSCERAKSDLIFELDIE